MMLKIKQISVLLVTMSAMLVCLRDAATRTTGTTVHAELVAGP